MAGPYRELDPDATERVSISGLPAPLGIARNAKGVLTASGRPILDLLTAAATGTPAYVYDLDAIGHSARGIVDALGRSGLCAYAIKANGAAPIVGRLLHEGCGIDCVSGGELRVALACGARPQSIVYSGVAKRDDELDLAIATGIRGIHVESVEEIERIAARARAGGRTGVPIAMRINPAIEVDTHAHIATGHDEAKFGIARDDVPRALEAVRLAGNHVRLVGLAVHIGSQNFQVEPYLAGLRVLCDFARTMRGRGIALQYLDAGGGFGVPYQDDQKAIPPAAFIHAALSELHARRLDDLSLLIEPGRALVAAHSVLVARVIQPKRSMAGGQERRWLLIDAGMNDLIRPALYQAYHRIEPLMLDSKDTVQSWRVAGPICESSDDFGTHPLPDPPPSLVAIRDVGAYGRSMASAYNARPLAAEVFVSGAEVIAVRFARPIEEVVAEEMGAATGSVDRGRG